MSWARQSWKDWPTGWAPQRESVKVLVQVPVWEKPKAPPTVQSWLEESVLRWVRPSAREPVRVRAQRSVLRWAPQSVREPAPAWARGPGG